MAARARIWREGAERIEEMCLNRKRLAMVLVLAVNLFFILGGGKSWAYVVAESRESNYVINSDGSYEYEVKMLFRDYVFEGDVEPPILDGYFSILPYTKSVKTTGFDSFVLYDNRPFSSYYEFQHVDPLGKASFTKNFQVELYHYYALFVPEEERNITILYSGAAGSWADKSSNVNLPWVDQAGYWEFTGGGSWATYIPDYTVNVTLPESVDSASVKLLGWDGAVNISPDNRFFQFTDSDTNRLDVNIAFKTTQPLAPVPEPVSSALFLLGGAFVGVVRKLRKRS